MPHITLKSILRVPVISANLSIVTLLEILQYRVRLALTGSVFEPVLAFYSGIYTYHDGQVMIAQGVKGMKRQRVNTKRMECRLSECQNCFSASFER